MAVLDHPVHALCSDNLDTPASWLLRNAWKSGGARQCCWEPESFSPAEASQATPCPAEFVSVAVIYEASWPHRVVQVSLLGLGNGLTHPSVVHCMLSEPSLWCGGARPPKASVWEQHSRSKCPRHLWGQGGAGAFLIRWFMYVSVLSKSEASVFYVQNEFYLC